MYIKHIRTRPCTGFASLDRTGARIVALHIYGQFLLRGGRSRRASRSLTFGRTGRLWKRSPCPGRRDLLAGATINPRARAREAVLPTRFSIRPERIRSRTGLLAEWTDDVHPACAPEYGARARREEEEVPVEKSSPSVSRKENEIYTHMRGVSPPRELQWFNLAGRNDERKNYLSLFR